MSSFEERRFEGRVALVTGGVRRVGLAIARALAARGARVLVTFHSSPFDEATRVIRELRSAGPGGAESYRCDLRQPSELIQMCDQLLKEHRQVDFLVNSAASFVHESLAEVSPESFDETMTLNLRAPLLLSQQLAPAMKKHHFGRIVNIADVAGFAPFPGYLPYSMSKAGLIAMTKGLARALAPEILVNAIAPGPVLLPDELTPAERDQAVRTTLLGRTGTAEDVAEAVTYLLGSSYITGVTLPVDGGRLVR